MALIVNPSTLPWRDAYRLMIGSIVPRPIAFVSTLSPAGVRNLAPFSFFTAVCPSPMTLCFAPMRRGSDGAKKDTLVNIEATGEFVINIVSEPFAAQMNATSAEFPPEVDEFVAAGLTPAPCETVTPPPGGREPGQLRVQAAPGGDRGRRPAGVRLAGPGCGPADPPGRGGGQRRADPGRQGPSGWGEPIDAVDGKRYMLWTMYLHDTFWAEVWAKVAVIAAAIAWVGLTGWLFLDARERGATAVAGWVLLGLLTGPIALAVWFISRPSPSRREVCPGCGADGLEGAAYCVRCGYGLKPACPACRRVVEADWSYCPACRTNLAAE